MPATATKPKPRDTVSLTISMPELPAGAELRDNELVSLTVADHEVRILDAAFAMRRGDTLTAEQSASFHVGGDDSDRRRVVDHALGKVDSIMSHIRRIGTKAEREAHAARTREAQAKVAAEVEAFEKLKAEHEGRLATLEAEAEPLEFKQRVIDKACEALRRDELLPPGADVRREVLRRFILQSAEGQREHEIERELRDLTPVAALWRKYVAQRTALGNAPVDIGPGTKTSAERFTLYRECQDLEAAIAGKAALVGVIASIDTSSTPGRQVAAEWAQEVTARVDELTAELTPLKELVGAASVDARRLRDFWIDYAERLALPLPSLA